MGSLDSAAEGGHNERADRQVRPFGPSTAFCAVAGRRGLTPALSP